MNLDNSALLLMSSGNYGGLDFDEVKQIIEANYETYYCYYYIITFFSLQKMMFKNNSS